jgi:hypothetical protein
LDERLVDPLPLRGLELHADEHLEGQVEGEILEHPLQLRLLHVLPVGEEPADVRDHQFVVAAQLLGAEGVLHDPAMVQVLLEVEQHQPAVEERTDEVGPRRAAREQLVLVDEDPLERLRTVERVHVDAEHTHLVDRAVLLAEPRGVLDRMPPQAEEMDEASSRADGFEHLLQRGGHRPLPPTLNDILKQSRSNVSSVHVVGDP